MDAHLSFLYGFDAWDAKERAILEARGEMQYHILYKLCFRMMAVTAPYVRGVFGHLLGTFKLPSVTLCSFTKFSLSATLCSFTKFSPSACFYHRSFCGYRPRLVALMFFFEEEHAQCEVQSIWLFLATRNRYVCSLLISGGLSLRLISSLCFMSTSEESADFWRKVPLPVFYKHLGVFKIIVTRWQKVLLLFPSWWNQRFVFLGPSLRL